MNKGFFLKFVRIWWAGIKVFFRWSAFWSVLVILWFPVMILTDLVGNYVGYVLGTIFFILTVPFAFYLTSKYLLLLGDNNQNDVQSNEITSDAPPVSPIAPEYKSKRVSPKIVMSILAVFLISSVLGPPDIVSQYALGFMAMFLCGVLLLILARTSFMKSLSSPKQTLICVLVCAVSVLSINVRLLYRIASCIELPLDFSSASSSSTFRLGNLWIMHLSGRGGLWLREDECVICSVDACPGFSEDQTHFTLTFADGSSVEVTPKKNETVWIDKDHKVTSLGSFLDRNDVSLLSNRRSDESLKISSPDELLALIKKLKAEREPSAAPSKAASY